MDMHADGTTDPSRCSRCGAAKSAGSPCPHCLLQLGLSLAPSDARQPSDGARRRQPAPDPAEIAAHFPGLDILEPIGQGGMGVVYRARQRKLDRFVALKILSPERSDDPAFAERFLREARAMARLDHPRIVKIHDFGETDGLCWLLMEHVDGVNLRAAMKSGALTPERALAIVPQLCDALQAAHDLGVVHRDIKPENVLLDRSGAVKIADFGLAKLSGAREGEETLTNPSVAMGTVHYMAPEQLHGAHLVDHRADIFSLGVVFYEMLTGALPIGRFEPPSRRVDVDVRLDEIVLRALEQAPERRYQQAVQVKTDVQGLRHADAPAQAPSDEPALGFAPGTARFDSAADSEASEASDPTPRRAQSRRQRFAVAAGFGLMAVLLPSILRVAWSYGAVGIGVAVAVTAVWLLLFALHRVERDPSLAAEMRARSPSARWFGRLAFLAVASAGLLAVGAGLLGLFELGTKHYVPPAPFANARFEPWSEDKGYELLQRLPEPVGGMRESPPELGEPQIVRYFREHEPAVGSTLIVGLALLTMASFAGFLPRGRWSPGVAFTPPLAIAVAVCVGFGMCLISRIGSESSLSSVTGTTVIHGRIEAVRESLLLLLKARGEHVAMRIERNLVAKRTRETLANHVLIVTQPASIFERWSLAMAEPIREQPALTFELTSAAGGEETHVLWDAGLLRIGQPIGDGWRRSIERLLDTVRARVGGG